MKDGYFFIGDILGFGKIIANTDSNTLPNRIDQWIELVKQGAKECKIDNFQLLSDTVFASTDSTPEGLDQLIRFGQYLLNKGVSKSLPIRGAITFGEYHWDNHNENFIYGKAVIDAHNLEMSQNWVGVACSQSVSSRFIDVTWPSNLVCYAVPKKNAVVSLHAAVIWDIPTIDELYKYLCGGNLTKKGDPLDWSFVDRIIHTINFKNYLKLVESNKYDRSKFNGTPNQLIENFFNDFLIEHETSKCN